MTQDALAPLRRILPATDDAAGEADDFDRLCTAIALMQRLHPDDRLAEAAMLAGDAGSGPLHSASATALRSEFWTCAGCVATILEKTEELKALHMQVSGKALDLLERHPDAIAAFVPADAFGTETATRITATAAMHGWTLLASARTRTRTTTRTARRRASRRPRG